MEFKAFAPCGESRSWGSSINCMALRAGGVYGQVCLSLPYPFEYGYFLICLMCRSRSAGFWCLSEEMALCVHSVCLRGGELGSLLGCILVESFSHVLFDNKVYLLSLERLTSILHHLLHWHCSNSVGKESQNRHNLLRNRSMKMISTNMLKALFSVKCVPQHLAVSCVGSVVYKLLSLKP